MSDWSHDAWRQERTWSWDHRGNQGWQVPNPPEDPRRDVGWEGRGWDESRPASAAAASSDVPPQRPRVPHFPSGYDNFPSHKWLASWKPANPMPSFSIERMGSWGHPTPWFPHVTTCVSSELSPSMVYPPGRDDPILPILMPDGTAGRHAESDHAGRMAIRIFHLDPTTREVSNRRGDDVYLSELAINWLLESAGLSSSKAFKILTPVGGLNIF